MKEDIKILEEYIEWVKKEGIEVCGMEKELPALENLLTRYKQLEQENNNYKAAALKNDDLYKEVCNKNKELEDKIEEFRIGWCNEGEKNEKLLKENEEWQRAYQEEKEKQFKLLRENKELEEENNSIKYLNEGLRLDKTLLTDLVNDLQEQIRNSIPKSLVKEKFQNKRNEIFGCTYVDDEQWKPFDKALDIINDLEKELLRRRGEIRCLIFTICQERRKWFLQKNQKHFLHIEK